MEPSIAYLAEGKLYLRQAGAAPRQIESPFVEQMLERVNRARQRNEWKEQGMAWNFSAVSGPFDNMGQVPAEMRRIRFSGLTRGQNCGELLYALDTDYMGGLFSYDSAEQHERRLYHRNQFRAQDLSRHPVSGKLALSVRADDGTANIAILDTDGRGLREVTEGDSVDEAPAWALFKGEDGQRDVLVYQSAGVARNEMGMVAALGPYAIQQLDLDRGKLDTLVEDEDHDLLAPRKSADRTLYFIRRPYNPHSERPSPWRVLRDILLFPFGVVMAIVHFLNFFSQVFARKPLLTAGGPPKEGPEQRHLMLWGKVIDAEKAMRRQKQGDDSAPLVPKDWRLIRREADGNEQVVAEGVLSFDLCDDGGLVYSDGAGIFYRDSSGDVKKVCGGKMIERVSVVG